jgi:WD40 repeat protein
VAFSSDGSILATANGDNAAGHTSSDGIVQLWHVATRTSVAARARSATLSTGTRVGVTSVRFSPNGSMLACGGANLMLWTIR